MSEISRCECIERAAEIALESKLAFETNVTGCARSQIRAFLFGRQKKANADGS